MRRSQFTTSTNVSAITQIFIPNAPSMVLYLLYKRRKLRRQPRPGRPMAGHPYLSLESPQRYCHSSVGMFAR